METMIPISRYNELERRHRESVVKLEALQSYVSRLPLRSEVDKLEAEVAEYRARLLAMTEALNERRKKEQLLCDEMEDVKRRLSEKPVDSARNLSAFLATEKVSNVLSTLETEIVRSKACARKWEARCKELSEENDLLETKLEQVERVLAKTRNNLQSAQEKLKYHQFLESEVLEVSRSVQRRLMAYTCDVGEMLSACSEALESKELTPVLLLGALIGQVRGVSAEVQPPIPDFASYLQYLESACNELVDIRDRLHTAVQRLVDSCTQYMADVNGSNTCLMQ